MEVNLGDVYGSKSSEIALPNKVGMLCIESNTESVPIRFGASLVAALCSPHG